MTEEVPEQAHVETLIETAAGIVTAYVKKNAVQPSDLAELVRSVHEALAGLGKPAASPEVKRLIPAVPIRKSVTPDYLVSLENGKKYKMLKRHLANFGMTPEAYRAKWGLPESYPIVAPNYTQRRSELARTFGLGRKSTARSASGRRRTPS